MNLSADRQIIDTDVPKIFIILNCTKFISISRIDQQIVLGPIISKNNNHTKFDDRKNCLRCLSLSHIASLRTLEA